MLKISYQSFKLTVSHMAKYDLGKWLTTDHLNTTRMGPRSSIKSRRQPMRVEARRKLCPEKPSRPTQLLSQ